MLFGIGTDIIEIERIDHAIVKNSRFLEKFFTTTEQEYFKSRKNRPETVAGYFAAKEAVSKALGTGVRKFNLIDIEIQKNEMGKPVVFLLNNAGRFAEENKISRVFVSISHSQNYAVANAVAEI